MKLASKKGKTFADVAKPIQNLIEKLKDKPQSQAVKNTQMLLENNLMICLDYKKSQNLKLLKLLKI